MAKDNKRSKIYMSPSDNYDENNKDSALTSNMTGNKSLFNPFKSPKQSKDSARFKSSSTPLASRSKSNERSSSSPSLMPKTYSKSTFYTELTPGLSAMSGRDNAAATSPATSGILRELGTSQSINKSAPVPISNTNSVLFPSNSTKQVNSSSYSDTIETSLVADTEKKLHTNSLPRESRQGKRLGKVLLFIKSVIH